MAGLLDYDQLANLQLAAGLLSRQPFGQALGSGLAGYQTTQDAQARQQLAAREMANREALQAAQISDMKAQEEQRRQAVAKQLQMQAMLQSVLGGQGQPSQYGAEGGGVSMGGVREPMRPQAAGLAGTSPEQIAALKANGIDVEKIWELAKFGKPMQPGYRQNADNTTSYFGDPSKGFTVDPRGQVGLMPGALDSQAGLAGATAFATTSNQQRAEAPYKQVQTVIGGVPRTVQLDKWMADQQPQQTQQPQQGPLTPMSQVRADVGNPATTYSSPAVQSAVQRAAGLDWPSRTTPGEPSGIQSGLSIKEKASATALDEVNKNWLDKSYTPTQEAGAVASSMLNNIQVARAGLSMAGNSGWSKDTQVKVARVIGALGVPQAEEVATGAQIFQQATSTRLWEVLNAAKGPQTEGDADRARQTFARIENTPKANQFIMDMMQAIAERDKIKAAWYRDALPIARQEGDLQMVDRKWSDRTPSVWSMPSMKKWGQ
jgi:hypothetical protein